MERFTEDSLKKLQYVLTEMLRQFDKICRDNGIDYWACYGTELGAARHQGIIPWDDDADVGMMRSDFEKLKKVFEEQDTGMLLLGYADGDYEWHEKVHPRIYCKGTIVESNYWQDCFELCGDKFGRAINVDIFLFDYTDNDPEKIRKIFTKSLKYKRNYMYYKFQSKIVKNRGAGAFVFSIIKRMKYFFHSSNPNASLKQYEKYLKLIAHEKSDYIVSYDDITMRDSQASLTRYDQTFPTIDGKFEGFTIKLQREYDTVLRKLYGDYMQLPPEDQRGGHSNYEVDFGDFKFPDSFGEQK